MNTYISMAITIVFCLFIIYIFYQNYRNVLKVKSFVKQYLESHNLDFLTSSEIFKSADDAYRSSMNVRVGEQSKTYESVETYIDANVIKKAVGINAKSTAAAPGVLSGLGVLGTFIGLTISVVFFDSTSSEAIMSSIKTLLGGMGTAFATSVVGMICSMIYIWKEKHWSNLFDKCVEEWTEDQDRKNKVTQYELIVQANNHHEQIMSNVVNTIKTAYEDNGSKIEKAVERISGKHQELRDELRGLLTYIDDEDDEEVTLGNAIRGIKEDSGAQAQALQSFTTDLSTTLNASLGSTMTKSMEESIVPLIHNLEEEHRALVSKFDMLNSTFKNPASDMMGNVVNELQTTLENIFTEFKSSITDKATSDLENLAQRLTATGDMLNSVPQNVENMTNGINETFEGIRQMIEKMQSDAATSTSENARQMQNQMTMATTALANAINDVRAIMQQMSEQQVSASAAISTGLKSDMNEISSSLKDTISSIQQQQNDTLSSVQNANTTMLSAINSNVEQMTGSVNDTVGQMTDKVKNTIDQMSEHSAQVSQAITNRMESELAKMTTVLQTTITALNAQQGDIIERHTNTGKELENVFVVMEEACEKMSGMANSVSDILSKMNNTSTELNNTAMMTKSTVNVLSETSTKLQNSQVDFLTRANQLQTQLDSASKNVITALEESAETSKEYANNFGVIKTGLQGIFSQVQEGLTQYSLTVKNSTGDILTRYSSSMTKALNNLEGVVNSLNDIVNELTDSLDRNKGFRR